jgi:hypothetical protein
MKALGPYFDWIARISAVIGVVLMLLGFISGLMQKSILPGFSHYVNYFLIADSFFLVTVVMYLHNIKHKNE